MKSLVEFSAVSEFTTEVLFDKERVEDGIVRVSIRRTLGMEIPTVTFALIATAVVNDVLIRLVRPIGGGLYMGREYDQQARRAAEAADEIREGLADELRGHGLDVRPGVFLWEPAAK